MMPEKLILKNTTRRLGWLGLALLIILQTTSSAMAQGSVMEIPAPKTQDRFNLLINSPPIWVKLKNWYCTDGSMSEGIAYELSEYIKKQEARSNSTKDLERKNAELAFKGMGEDYDFADSDYYLSPKFGPFNPSPGSSMFKSVKHCYTKDELNQWHEFVKKIEKHLLNHPDPLKEAKRLLPNF